MPKTFINQWVLEIYFFLQEKKMSVQKGTVPNKKHGTSKSQLMQKNQNLTVIFLDSTPAKKLNLKFRKKNYATDVLSFDGDGFESLGELVLCPQVLQKQAEEHDLSFRQELGYMLIHGILHLIGYDHEKNQKEAQKMFQIQDEMFDQLCRKFWK